MLLSLIKANFTHFSIPGTTIRTHAQARPEQQVRVPGNVVLHRAWAGRLRGQDAADCIGAAQRWRHDIWWKVKNSKKRFIRSGNTSFLLDRSLLAESGRNVTEMLSSTPLSMVSCIASILNHGGLRGLFYTTLDIAEIYLCRYLGRP